MWVLFYGGWRYGNAITYNPFSVTKWVESICLIMILKSISYILGPWYSIVSRIIPMGFVLQVQVVFYGGWYYRNAVTHNQFSIADWVESMYLISILNSISCYKCELQFIEVDVIGMLSLAIDLVCLIEWRACALSWFSIASVITNVSLISLSLTLWECYHVQSIKYI